MPFKDPKKKKAYYLKHYALHAEEARLKQNEKKRELRKRVHDIKEKSGCVDCGMKYPYYVLHFDHRDGSTKKAGISRIVSSFKWKTIEEEIQKCDIVCANCHAERTYRRSHDWPSPNTSVVQKIAQVVR